MGKITDFFKKNNVAEDEIELQAGGRLKLLGKVENIGELVNQFTFPVEKEYLTQDMIDFQKRYQMTMAVEQMMKKVMDNPDIAIEKVGILFEPQKIEEINGHSVLTTRIELVLPVVVDLRSDVVVRINDTEDWRE